MNCMCPADGFLTCLGEAAIANFARLHQFSHDSGNILNWHLGIHPMLIKEVDAIGLQAPQRLLDYFADVVGAAISSLSLSIGDAKPELGRNHRLLALPLKRASEKLFIHKRAIDLSRIKKIEP